MWVSWGMNYIKSSESKIIRYYFSEGKNFNMVHCGMHAMDIMRMESGYLHWGHDISVRNQYQTGLSFAISYKKI